MTFATTLELVGPALAFVSVSSELLGLLAWLGLLLAISFVARWWFREPEWHDGVTVEYDPPSCPPGEVYEDALDYGTSAETHAERLFEDGYYERAHEAYYAAQSAYVYALDVARSHPAKVGGVSEHEGVSRARPERPRTPDEIHDHLDWIEDRIEKARHRRDFWRISMSGPGTNLDKLGASRENYESLVDRGETSQWWADKLFDDGHHENAYREYEVARDAYERALEIADEFGFTDGKVRSRLEAVQTRMTECRDG